MLPKTKVSFPPQQAKTGDTDSHLDRSSFSLGSSAIIRTFYSGQIQSLSRIGNGAQVPAMGTSVTISGSNLLDGGGEAAVTFNGTPAAISSDTSGRLQVTVPTGATSGRVLVKVNGVTMVAAADFTITPSA